MRGFQAAMRKMQLVLFVLVITFCQVDAQDGHMQPDLTGSKSASNSNVAPESPESFYVTKGTSASIPCFSYDSKARLQWRASRQPASISRRMSTQQVPNPNMLMLSISNTKPSDAGLFTCTDQLTRQQSRTELVLVDPRPPVDVEAKVTSSDEIMVKWKAPVTGNRGIRSYKLYVTEVTDTARTTSFEKANSGSDDYQSFLLRDLKPGATYDIEIAAVYFDGPGDDDVTNEGPKSAKIRIQTSNFESPPTKVKAIPWRNSTVLVKWEPPLNVDDRAISGYIVMYKSLSRLAQPPKGEVHIKKKAPNGKWQAVLRELPVRQRYEVRVSAVSSGQQGIVGKKSPPAIVRHDGFPSELSIKATAIDPETILVTLNTVGGGDISKLRLLYSDDSATRWQRVRFNSREKSAIISRLQPRSTYFFMARARLDKKTRQVVTHATTPPSPLESPIDLNVVPQTDHSVEATWKYTGRGQPKGYILYLDMKDNDTDTFRPFKQKAVIGKEAATVDGLDDHPDYRAKVVPFDTDGLGPGTEIFFQIAPTDEVTTTTTASQGQVPSFFEVPEDLIQINHGERFEAICMAGGEPRPTVTWYKDGQSIGRTATVRNVLVLASVTESFVLTCEAVNSLGSIRHDTTVQVTQGIRSPPAIVPMPETLELQRGQRLSLVCQAMGIPEPKTSWYRNGRPVGGNTNIEGPNEYLEERVTSDFSLTCRARNSGGTDESRTQVTITSPSGRAPVLAKPLPKQVTKRESEDLSLECAFKGQPTPEVAWYDGDQPILASSPGSSILFIPSVQASTTLKCKGINSFGETVQMVKLLVLPREGNRADYRISLRSFPKSPNDVELKWKVDEGNLERIRGFTATLMSDSGRNLLRERLDSNQRSLLLTSLSPGRRYTIKLDTIGPTTEVHTAENSFVPQDLFDQNPALPFPALKLEVVEIREDSARVALSPTGVDPSSILHYRLQLKDLQVSDLANTVSDRRLSPRSNSMRFLRLQPNRSYQVLVEVQFKRRKPSLTADVTFTTANTGGTGTDVMSIGTRNNAPATRPVVTTTTTTTTTTRPPTTPYIPPTTPFRTRTLPPQRNPAYVMNVKAANKTPFTVDIRWAVDRGDLDKVNGFLVTITGSRGQRLLEQLLQSNQRSITIQSLSASTRYNVKVAALGPGGLNDVLTEKVLDIYTPSENAVIDTSNPFLDFEAREVRSSTVRLVWAVINGDPLRVASYRLKVFDRDQSGRNLLTQNIPARSQSLHLKLLPPNKYFYVTLDAIDQNGRTLMSSSLTFATVSPGEYGIPVTARHRSDPNPQNPRQPNNLNNNNNNINKRQPISPPRRRTTQVPPLPTRPVLTLEIRPHDDAKTARLTWTVVTPDPQFIQSYRINVRLDDGTRRSLLTQDMTLNTAYFDLFGLLNDRSYIIELHGLDRRGQPVVTASTRYMLPPPGRNAQPLIVSSEDPDNTAPRPTTTLAPDRELVIIGAESVGRGTVKLTWLTTDGRIPTKPVMIQYAPFYGHQRGDFRFQYAGASQQEAVITGLNPGTNYEFQVAIAPDGAGQYVQWSLPVRRQTDP